MRGMVEDITIIIQNEYQPDSEIKTHDEITHLLDSVKTVEESFSNLDFLQNLPEMIKFQSEEIIESKVTPLPDIDSDVMESIDTQDRLTSIPPKTLKNRRIEQIKPLHQRKKRLPLRLNFHNYIVRPLLAPPAPGHTTFTISLNKNKVSGFYQKPTQTRSLKELGPVFKKKSKTLLQTLKNRDFKKDITIFKKLPNTLKKIPSKLNIDSIKTIPKKIRVLFSSD